MNLDDILELAAARKPSSMERARIRRAGRRILDEAARSVAQNRNPVGDVNVEDPLDPTIDEGSRIARAAQLAKRGSLSWDAGTDRMSWSDEMALIFGRPPGTVKISVDVMVRAVHPDDAESVKETVELAWRTRTPAELTFRLVRPDGTLRYVDCLVELLTDTATAEPSGVVITADDVTDDEVRRREDDLRRRRRELRPGPPTERDPLTSLLTRERFIDEVDAVARAGCGTVLIVAAAPTVRNAAVSEADVERLTRMVADVMGRGIRPGDVCGVVGPGEFGVVLTDVTVRTAEAIAFSIVDTLRERLTVGARNGLKVTAWGGLVPFSAQDRTAGGDLISDARWAWRQARHGSGRVEVLTGPLGPHAREETCRAEIESVVASDGLSLYSQPILDLSLNQITRQEILLRVHGVTSHPEPPAAFLDVAERVDDILAVDTWVVDRSLALIRQGPPTPHYQINLSGRSLSHPALLDHVREALQRYEVEPDRITFELTESAVVRNLTAAVRFAEGINELGSRLAVDDFGAGHTSLRDLKYLPIDLVKIDGDFIRDLPRSPFDQILVRSTVEMCDALGFQTAAEYVQDAQTIELLRDYRVTFAQGYAVGRPSPVAVTPDRADSSAEGGWENADRLLRRATG